MQLYTFDRGILITAVTFWWCLGGLYVKKNLKTLQQKNNKEQSRIKTLVTQLLGYKARPGLLKQQHALDHAPLCLIPKAETGLLYSCVLINFHTNPLSHNLSKANFWSDSKDSKGRLIHRKIQ